MCPIKCRSRRRIWSLAMVFQYSPCPTLRCPERNRDIRKSEYMWQVTKRFNGTSLVFRRHDFSSASGVDDFWRTQLVPFEFFEKLRLPSLETPLNNTTDTPHLLTYSNYVDHLCWWQGAWSVSVVSCFNCQTSCMHLDRCLPTASLRSCSNDLFTDGPLVSKR